MNLIITLVSVLAVWTGLKFVFLVFKRLGSKNSMNDFIDGIGEKMNEKADEFAGYLKKKEKERKRKARMKKAEEDRPVVTIR